MKHLCSSISLLNISQAFNDLKVCVIIPTYNNALTLENVIADVLQYTNNIIVVNDGSTDDTESILKHFESITVVSYKPNAGKGMALRKGFKKAIELGHEYAVTIDSDGQHFAKDLPIFIEKLKTDGPGLIMGARNMDSADNVPGKSSFGNKFSNFWYKVETGIELPDTQTGYRLYPLKPICKMNFFTRKYEFEIEIIVRLAWAGTKVSSVPITVYYPPKEERISHFRPFKDFTRISIVNTVLVIICFFYIWPRNFFRRFYKNKNWKLEVKQMLLKPGETNLAKANAIAFGGFMGVVPIWGFQLIVAIALSHVFKLNKALVVLAAHISFAPMLPLIIFFSYKLGKPFMGSRAVDISLDKELTLSKIGQNLEQYIYGSMLLAIIVSISFWLITFLFLKLRKRSKR
ncbi:DUF2062 domain-containing protein [Niabella ginsengisoli]|uniref:DUF2062 domain-containing protein n=1 Tax=Niabella ginsengisoli TaxID=522298 RepID=A0ABS9SP58_9BACT|nr:DUF2062 domain-containing protein [Niabella ginsengisoli]MCH5600071.1 DUF2062 domain-containing protein [Niabella ginsengisoli]